MKKAISLLLIACCVTASAGTRDPSTPDRKHLEYGSQFKCVVKLRARRNEDGLFCTASAVAISPRHIVTAAHVVEDSHEWEVVIDGRKIAVSGISVHPQYDNDRMGHNDIAVGTLAEDAGLDFYPPLYSGDSETGRVVAVSGWGMHGTFATGASESDDSRRAGSNVVDGVVGGMLVCSVSGGRRTELEFLIAPGDSGGGLFLDGELAGVNSLVMRDGHLAPKYGYGEESGHTRVTLHRAWILEQTHCD